MTRHMLSVDTEEPSQLLTSE